MLKKICNTFSTILLIFLALLAAVLIVPYLFGFKSMAVLTGSMEPAIGVGSIVYVKETPFSDLKEGDIITYYLTKDTMVTHRIESIDYKLQQVMTKGDANQTNDGAPIPASGIFGKAYFHLPDIGFVSIYAKTPIGIAVICGLLILIILLNFLPEIFGTQAAETEEKVKMKNADI